LRRCPRHATPGRSRFGADPLADSIERPRANRRHGARDILVYGVAVGLLVVAVRLTEYRFLVVEHSVEVYAGLIAILAAGLGIWLGRSLKKRRPAVVAAAAADGFAPDAARLSELGITPRELEILELIAAGLSNREIGERLFVSENTVKTHASRLFDKLGARRRTQAVQIGKSFRLIS
jgi:DNA-binding NarL/FixJ family response regulator